MKLKSLVSLTTGLAISGITAIGSILPAEAVAIINGDFSSNAGSGQIDYNTTLTGWTSGNNGFSQPGYNFLYTNATIAQTTGVPNVYATPTSTNNLILWGPLNTVDSRGNPIAPSNNGFAAPPVPSGAFIAADGDPSIRGTISQQLTGLIPGNSYDISFWDAAAQQVGYDGDTTEQWQVSLIGASQTNTRLSRLYELPNHGFSGWNYNTLPIVASDSTVTLSFLALGTPSGLPPFSLLAGVTVSETVPEPLEIAGTLVGFGACVVLRSKLKKK
jgi:hypothetical protein